MSLVNPTTPTRNVQTVFRGVLLARASWRYFHQKSRAQRSLSHNPLLAIHVYAAPHSYSTHIISTRSSQPKYDHHAGVIPSSSHAEPVIFGLLNIPIMYGFLFDGNAGRISRLVRLETILVHLEPSSHLGSK